MSKLPLIISAFLSVSLVNAEECKNPVVSGPPIFPPYIVPIDDVTRGGIAVDKAMAVLTPLVGKPVLDQTKPWPRVLKEFEAGTIDILFVTLYNPDRESYARFTNPWIFDNYGVVTTSNSTFDWESVESLDSMRGGYYHSNYLPHPFGDYIKDNPNVTGITQVDSMYKMLASGRVDYLIVALQTFQLLKPEGFTAEDFTIHEKSTSSIPVHMAISKNSPCIELFDEINKAVSY